MKITGARQNRFLGAPPADIIGVLLFGPDRGRVKSRGAALAKVMVPDVDPTFGSTLITADDLTGDPAKLADEMSAMSLLGGGRLVRLRLDHERQAAAISKLIKGFDTDPSRAEAKLIIEAGDMTTMQERAFSMQLDIWGLRMLKRSLAECQAAERASKTAGAPIESIVSRLLLALAGYAAKRR